MNQEIFMFSIIFLRIVNVNNNLLLCEISFYIFGCSND
jgi:hypothetical protein